MVLTDIVHIDRIAYDFIGGCGGQLINVDMADYDKIRADAVRLKAVKVEIRNRSELKSLGEDRLCTLCKTVEAEGQGYGSDTEGRPP